MQSVKNLFLWNARSYVRKAIEIPLALYADLVWGKRREMEIYLNVVEWGPGVFGVEAAAQHYFKRPAKALTASRRRSWRRRCRTRWRATPPIPAAGLRALARTIAAKARRAGGYIDCLYPVSLCIRPPSHFRRISIMAVPKRKTSPSKRGFRRSADALKRPAYVEDKDSGELRRPHHVDLKSGMYRGRQVLHAEGGSLRPRLTSACSEKAGLRRPFSIVGRSAMIGGRYTTLAASRLPRGYSAMLTTIPLTVVPLDSVQRHRLCGRRARPVDGIALHRAARSPAHVWNVSLGDLMILLGLVMLFFETLRSARPGVSATISNHIDLDDPADRLHRRVHRGRRSRPTRRS